MLSLFVALISAFSFADCSVPQVGEDLTTCKYAGQLIEGKNFLGNSLRGVSFAGARLRNTTFVATNLDGADFSNSDLSEVSFVRSQGVDAKFSLAKLQAIVISSGDWSGAFFQHAQIRNLTFKDIRAVKISFWQSTLTKVSFVNSFLPMADFGSAKIEAVDFETSQLSEAFFGRLSGKKLGFNQVNLADSSWKEAMLTNCEVENSYIAQAVLPNNCLATALSRSELSVGKPVMSDVAVTANALSPECLKRFPLGKPNRPPRNGVSLLSNLELEGNPFRPCLEKVELDLELRKDLWPMELRDRLMVEIVLNNYIDDLEAVEVSGEKVSLIKKKASVLVPVNKGKVKLAIHFKDPTSGIYEVRLSLKHE